MTFTDRGGGHELETGQQADECSYHCLDERGDESPVYQTIPRSQSHLHKQTASVWAVMANLITGGLGSGILSLPWAMAGASVFPSIVTIALVMLLNVVTVMILVEAAERYQAFDLGALLGHLPGRAGTSLQALSNAFTAASVFLCLVSYVVVVADSLEPLAFSAAGIKHHAGLRLEGAEWWTVRAPVLLLGGLGVLPLCFLDQHLLSFSSTLGILMNIYLVIVVLSLFAGNGVTSDCCLLGISHGTITMYSSLMQCAILQMCVLPMYEQLQDRSPKRFGMAVGGAFIFLSTLFVAFAGAAYFVFGPGVHSNVIMDFPADIWGSVARAGTVVSMLAVYPVIATSIIAPIRHWEEVRTTGSLRITAALTVAVVMGSAVAAGFSQHLGTLNSLNGAMQVACFVALAPGIIGLYMLGRKGTSWRIFMACLIIFGLVTSMLGVTYTSNDPFALAESCLWVMMQS